MRRYRGYTSRLLWSGPLLGEEVGFSWSAAGSAQLSRLSEVSNRRLELLLVVTRGRRVGEQTLKKRKIF